MSDLESMLGLAGVPLMEKEPAGWQPSEKQAAWLFKDGGKPNTQDPYIMWRMYQSAGGTPPPISYFKDPEDQELAKAIGFREGPAPVVDKSVDKQIDPDAPGEDMNTNPDMKPAVKTQARPDDKNKSEPKELPAEPTASDIDPDAPGEDMNTNPDMTPAKAEFEPDPDLGDETGAMAAKYGIDPSGQQADQLARQEKGMDDEETSTAPKGGTTKFDPEIGRFVDYDEMGRPDYHELYNLSNPDATPAQPEKAADFEADPEIGDKTGEIAARYGINPNSQQADQLARQELGMDDVAKAKQAANPQASADTQKGTDQNAMRDTMDKLFGRDGESMSTAGGPPQAQSTLKPADQVLSPDDEAELAAKYDIDAANRDIADANKEIADLDQEIARLQGAMNQDNGLDTELPQAEPEQDYQDMGPGSVKNMLNKALATEPKVDMDKPMPSGIRSGEDLYKALDGNLNWLDKNIK